MTRRLLVVEPSATMRHVLEKHLRALGYEVEATETYASASESLEKQFREFTADFAGMIFGWPSVPEEDADTLSERLESPDFADLPIVVMSTDMRAGTRAWVAGRPQTAMLAWKDYLGVDALLERLLDNGAADETVQVSKFDNNDINVLVVDDSRTIRHSLRDLFELQGYRVGLAASAAEALEAARETRFDIAVLDFYLEETTGDVLCRDLVSDPACGGVVCAVLTGTYADHIIKRSLRAGAVECMFKNESSELLLTRIDAISRFVRQRRELSQGCDLLERALGSVAGAALVLDSEGSIRYLSNPALVLLGIETGAEVAGRTLQELVGSDVLPDVDSAPLRLTWNRPGGGEPMRVMARHRIATGEGESMVLFEPASDVTISAASASSVAGSESPSAASGRAIAGAVDTRRTNKDGESVQQIVMSLALDSRSVEFVDCLRRYRQEPPEAPDRISLLIIGVHERITGRYRPLDRHGETFRIVDDGLRRLYRREHHVACLSEHRFGLLIRHIDDPQSYLLTRRLMQLCNDLAGSSSGTRLATVACLTGLKNNLAASSAQILGTALRGLEVVESRGLDQALLLDLKRTLAVYPATTPPAEGKLAAPDAG